MNFGEIGDFSCGFDLYDVAQPDPEILPDGFVHSDFAIFKLIVDKGHHQSLFSLLAFDEDSIAFEDFEFGHFGLA